VILQALFSKDFEKVLKEKNPAEAGLSQ